VYKKRVCGSYIKLLIPNRGEVLEHRYVFEQYYNCCLLKTAVIHHKDGNGHNNNIDNLQLTDRKNHKKLPHKPQRNGLTNSYQPKYAFLP
jgi:hypothetical protein